MDMRAKSRGLVCIKSRVFSLPYIPTIFSNFLLLIATKEYAREYDTLDCPFYCNGPPCVSRHNRFTSALFCICCFCLWFSASIIQSEISLNVSRRKWFMERQRCVTHIEIKEKKLKGTKKCTHFCIAVANPIATRELKNTRLSRTLRDATGRNAK